MGTYLRRQWCANSHHVPLTAVFATAALAMTIGGCTSTSPASPSPTSAATSRAATSTASEVASPPPLGSFAHLEFEPLATSASGYLEGEWEEPYLLPPGFAQTLIHDESGVDLYPQVPDMHEMNTTNETGLDQGRYLYSTHEVDLHGAVTVVDLENGTASILVQDADWGLDWRRLDGIRWTPWGTILVNEERPGGHVYEIQLDASHPTTATAVTVREALGSKRHEGIDVDASGHVYGVDELDGGSIYRFVPDKFGDLSQGDLQVLRLTGLSPDEQKWNPNAFAAKTGHFEWVVVAAETALTDADVAANAVDATEFGRPEDIEIIGEVLYVANTSEDRVIAVDLARQTVSTFVQAGLNVPVESPDAPYGLHHPDNLAAGPDGCLWLVEDNPYSDIYRACTDANGDGLADTVELFGSLKDPQAETTGIYVAPGGNELYVTVQHPLKPLSDGIWRITVTHE